VLFTLFGFSAAFDTDGRKSKEIARRNYLVARRTVVVVAAALLLLLLLRVGVRVRSLLRLFLLLPLLQLKHLCLCFVVAQLIFSLVCCRL